MSTASIHLLRRWSIAAGCALAALAAQAQPEPIKMPAEKVSPAIVPAEVPATNAAVASRHRCGGIGADESAAMRAQMKNHPLSLLFAQPGGAYLADVQVSIEGAPDKPALVFRAEGPVCLIDLPPGSYTVRASSAGVMRNQSVTIGTAPKTVDFRF